MKNNRMSRRKKIIRRRRITVGIIGGFLLLSIGFTSYKILNKSSTKNNVSKEDNNKIENVNTKTPEVEKKEILITSAGDCTLGTDTSFGYEGSFQYELDIYNNDYSL